MIKKSEKYYEIRLGGGGFAGLGSVESVLINSPKAAVKAIGS